MWYKGTKEDCESYNDKVTKGEGYNGTTQHWSSILEIEGDYFIIKNESYPSEMQEVKELPIIDEI